MANRPYKNVERFVESVSKDINASSSNGTNAPKEKIYVALTPSVMGISFNYSPSNTFTYDRLSMIKKITNGEVEFVFTDSTANIEIKKDEYLITGFTVNYSNTYAGQSELLTSINSVVIQFTMNTPSYYREDYPLGFIESKLVVVTIDI